MKLSCILTIANRTPEVCKQVADSLLLPGNTPDELIVVLDRPTPEVRDGAHAAYDRMPCRVSWITIPGEPAWRSPVKAWNLGFLAATGTAVYCFSSETVQKEGNLNRARRELAGETYDTHPIMEGIKKLCLHGSVSCSCGPEGTEVNWAGSAPGNLFCDAKHPRPLGFIWAAPTWAVKQIGGYDEKFAEGLWHDDDDLFLRLWRTGLDYIFDDSISGTHLHHERPVLSTPDGQAKIALNQAYMLSKHGTPVPWAHEPRTVETRPGRTIWRHL